MPSSQLDPIDSRRSFSLPVLLSAGIDLPEATASMVDASTDLAPLAIPEVWQDVSFSGLTDKRTGAPLPPGLPPPAGGADSNWADFFPHLTGSLPIVTEESARETGTRAREKDLLAPVSIKGLPPKIPADRDFSREEKSLSIDIEIVEMDSPIAPDPSTRTRLYDARDTVPEVPPPRPLPVPEEVIVEEVALDDEAPTTRPAAVSGVDAARALFMRAATGGELSARESDWLLRCLAAVLLDGLDDGRLASIVSRLGPPPR